MLQDGLSKEQRDEMSKEFKEAKAADECSLRTMQEWWWSNLADEIQTAAESKKIRSRCTAWCDKHSVPFPLKPLMDMDGISKRWEKHFSELLNRPSSKEVRVLDKIPQRPIVIELDNQFNVAWIDLTWLQEGITSLQRFSAMVATCNSFDARFYSKCLEEGEVPKDWKGRNHNSPLQR